MAATLKPRALYENRGFDARFELPALTARGRKRLSNILYLHNLPTRNKVTQQSKKRKAVDAPTNNDPGCKVPATVGSGSAFSGRFKAHHAELSRF